MKDKLTFEQECKLIANGEALPEEKQIEEMAKFMHYKAHGKDKDCNNEKCQMCWCSCKNDAELLYNAGYRKIPKDSVVLSREEYKLLFDIKKKFETADGDEITAVSLLMWLKELTAQERKETAEKFAKAIFYHITTPEIWGQLQQNTWLNGYQSFKGNKHIWDLLIEPIAKQLGIEIKE